MKHLFLFLSLSFLYSAAFSQKTFPFTGKVVDKAGKPVFAANVSILHLKDSTMAKGTTTSEKGEFNIPLLAGEYLCRISFIGYESKHTPFTMGSKSLSIGNLVLESKVMSLGEIQIMEKAAPVVQKDDTTEFNAAAFKVNENATTEDLVTKMPGVILQDGKVQAQGEQVAKVLVDGKPFLGNDPSAALKNLPADAVDKIQIYDGKSEQAQFTGFDDGTLIKTMNIVTKGQYNKGVFGRVFGGVGYKDKWRAGGIVNLFNKDERISFLLNSNNVNEQNFTMDDMSSMMGSGGGRMQRGGGMYGGSSPGIIITNMFGVNYSNTWKNVDFSGSYFFNRTDNEMTNYTNRSYLGESTGLIYIDSTQSKQISMNHRINFKLDWRIDSVNSLLFEPSFLIQQSDISAFSVARNFINGLQSNYSSNDSPSNSTSFNGSTSLLYRHKFGKAGRTISINARPGYNQTSGESTLNSSNEYWNIIETQAGVMDTSLITELKSQHAILERKGYVFSGNITYTEPLSTYFSTLFTYQTSYNLNDSEKKSYDNLTSLLDSSLSNVFVSRYFSNSLGGNLRYQREKYYIMMGVSYQYASLDNDRTFPVENQLKKDFPNLLPSAEFRYNFSKQENLRMSYRSSTNIPSVTQLQPVLDNSNTLLLSIGNENLKQESRNSFSMNYSKTNPTNFSNFFAMIYGTYTTDYIGNNTIIAVRDTVVNEVPLARGVQLKTPENFEAYYQMRSFVMYGFPITPLKINFNINGSFDYSKTPSLLNSQLNYSNNYGLALGLVASSNISQNFDFTISSNSRLTYGQNSLQSAANSKYLNQNLSVKINVSPFGGLTLGTELVDRYYSGFEGNTKQNYIQWNAHIGYKFLKNKQLEARVSVYDILNENKSLSRSITEAYYEEVISNTLTRYLMFHLAWNFKTFAGQAPEGKRMQMGRGSRRME